MKNKRILNVIVKYFYPVAAGIETNTLETYSVLAKKGWDVTFHTSKDNHIEKDVYADFEVYRGIKIKRYSFGKFGFTPDIDYSKTDIVALHNFDIFPHFILLINFLWMKLIGKKHFGLVLTPHGGFTPEWRVFPKLQAVIKGLYHFTLGTLLINSVVDKMRAVSDWERDEAIKKLVFNNKVVVISNGLEDEAFENIEKKASQTIKKQVKGYGKYFVQIGRVYPIKNYETTIRALAQLSNDYHFVIAGPISDKQYKTNLDTLIASLGLEKRVHFAGVIRGIDKYYLIKKSVAMVHMAMWESFCNVVHEGMSQGKVCVVANNTALPLLIKDKVNGFCVETMDVAQLKKTLQYVTNPKNKKEMDKMAILNKELSHEHTWSKVAEKMNELYQNLMENWSEKK